MTTQARSFTIRTVTVEDAPSIQAIYAPYVANTVISFEAAPPSVEEMAQRIQKTVNKFPWLVCVTDAQKGSGSPENGEPGTHPALVGYAYASTHRERAAYQWSVDVSVYVHPDFQRRSIGRGLYTALFALLRLQGYVNAYAGIALPNPASVGMHTALGFQAVGVYRQVGYKLGAWHDVGWWGLCLTTAPCEPLPLRPISDFVDTPAWSHAIENGQAVIRESK
ncbi:MAG: N-acetyltransferase [Caldilineaceae bacterium]|nr:N-acetyltransferase [Caldilineaceae bacterium]